MKQKDIAVIIATVGVSAILSFVLCNQFIDSAAKHNLKAETVELITADFDLPDKTVFNENAINPTKLIEIGPNTNNQPFSNE